MKNKIISTIMLFSIYFVSLAHCQPVVTMSDAIDYQKGKMIVSIILNKDSDTPFYGYAFRMDYDSTVLSNPTYLTPGTISENSNILFSTTPCDNFGKITISSYDLQSDTGGVLIKLVFDIHPDKKNSKSNIEFIDKNLRTVLFKAGFEKISTHFYNKTIKIKQFDLQYLIQILRKISSH
jgi:hypothetical protein